MEAEGSYTTFVPSTKLNGVTSQKNVTLAFLRKLDIKNVQIKFYLVRKGKNRRTLSFILTGKPYCPSQCTGVWCNVKDDSVLNKGQTFHRKRELLSNSKQMTSYAEILPSLRSIGLTYTRNSSLRKLQLQGFDRYLK